MDETDERAAAPTPGPTRMLAEAAFAVREAALPAATIAMTRQVVLDTIGCMLGAIGTPQAAALNRAMDRDGSRGDATVIGRAAGAGAVDAAYANALLAHVLELDDTHRTSVMHVAAPVVAAALAVAERRNSNGDALLRAIVAGYEAAVRVGIAIQPGHWYKGFLSMATCGAIGAAVAAGHLLGFDADRLAQAMGLAAIQASGLNASIFAGGDMGKATTPAAGAMNGVRSALLVDGGLTGPTTILEGRFGVFEVWAKEVDLARALDGLGERYEIDRTALKPFSCCRYIHGPIQLTAGLMARHALDAADIARITVRTYEAAVINRPHRASPLTLFDAKMSIPYCLAVQLESGRFDEALMEGSIDRRSALAPIAEKVEVLSDPAMTGAFPAEWPSSVEITDVRGASYRDRLSFPKGEPENPLTEVEVLEKFRYLALKCRAPDEVEAIAKTVLSLDATTRVGELMARLATAPPRAAGQAVA